MPIPTVHNTDGQFYPVLKLKELGYDWISNSIRFQSLVRLVEVGLAVPLHTLGSRFARTFYVPLEKFETFSVVFSKKDQDVVSKCIYECFLMPSVMCTDGMHDQLFVCDA